MKKLALAVLSAAVVFLFVPLFLVKNSAAKDFQKIFSSDKENKYSLTEMLACEFREEYCDEGLKAVALVLNTNALAGQKPKTMEKAEFVKRYGKDNYSKIEKYAEEIGKTHITFKGKTAALPYSRLCGENESKTCPYIKPLARPRDRLDKEYAPEKDSQVLSLNTLNSLCESGLSAEEALGRMLNDCEVN